MVHWPCIIKHSDDAELVYVSDQTEWDNNTDLHDFAYDESDLLIDSSGKLFCLAGRENVYIKPDPRGDSMALQNILDLIKAHAAQKGSCCVAKLYAPTIEEAFKIVASLEEG